MATRSKREDVAASRGGGAKMPGFNQSVDFSELEPGNYRLVVVFEKDGAGHVCDNGREIRLQ